MSTTTDEIKARVDLADLIGRSVQLRRSGSSLKGLCPFHQEKTPSFYVFPQSHTFKCFGCGKGGTAFDWMMEREHLDFGEALRVLAQMAGVELPARRDPEQEETSKRLYDLLSQAQLYYQGLLQGTAGAAGRHYLAGRGVNDETMTSFGLGFATSGNGLMRYLKEAGFTDEEMVASAVVSIADDGRHFDFFRERVLFPIRDSQGRTIAFGGRALDNATPKYLNSRDTLLFHKQETLFALDLSRRAIGQERRAVIVEGYMDALMAHQHGYHNVVATLGTAVTERHLGMLGRLADEIVLALDSDAAGQAATWRTLQVAEQGLRRGLAPVVGPSRRQRQYVADRAAMLKILTMPEAKDPDEYIRGNPTGWAMLVQAAKPVIDFVLDRLGDRHDLSSARGKADAAEEVGEILAGIANPIEHSHYVQRVAQLLQVDERAVRGALRGKQRSGRTGGSAAPGRADDRRDEGLSASALQPETEEDRLDEYALALLWRARTHRGESDRPAPTVELRPEHLALAQSRALYQTMVAHQQGAEPGAVGERVPEPLREHLRRVERFSDDVARLDGGELQDELERVALRMKQRALLTQKAQIHALLRDAESIDEHRAWMEQLSRLAHELRETEDQIQRVGQRTAQAVTA